jgi:hypothetical protein
VNGQYRVKKTQNQSDMPTLFEIASLSRTTVSRRHSKATVDVTDLETLLLNQSKAKQLLALVPETQEYFSPLSPNRMEAREILENLLKRGEMERFTSSGMSVSPAMALEMLSLNKMNRPIIISKVKYLIESMASGQFMLTHQGMAITKDRVLNDGQKRLWAIAITGTTCEIDVTFGVIRKEFGYIDKGQVRTVGDDLYCKMRKHHNQRAAALALLIRENPTVVTKQDMAELEESMDQDVLDEACEAGSKIRDVMNRTACTAAYYKIAMESPVASKLPQFYDMLHSGAISDRHSPILKFREEVRKRSRLLNAASRAAIYHQTGMMIFAWNAWLQGNRIKTSDWDSFDGLPEVG